MTRRFILKSENHLSPANFQVDYASELNEQQYQVVTGGGGPVLVVAGAGTGKTRTLVYRVAHLVERGISPEQILLLTFTRRAAREMLGRASTLLDGRCERVRGGTFHAFCLSILRQYATRINYPPAFSILDAADSADVINIVRTHLGLHKSEIRFPKKNTIQFMFSAMRNRNISLRQVLEREFPHFEIFQEHLEDLFVAYQSYKVEHGLMDYDDLPAKTAELLAANEAIARDVSAGCRHVLVDEYQDTNRLQAELVKLFSSVHGNVMAVGDDAQSIYRFRGADFRNIISFTDDFPGARIYKLEHNYRSTQPILNLANHVIEGATRKYKKYLFSDRKEGQLPALVQAEDEQYQSRFVAQVVMQLREEGIPLNKMAVLFRSSHDAFDLEAELAKRNIPYVKYGGTKLTEAAHIKDVLAYLRVLENPKDVIAWNRILLLIEGIGPKSASDLTSIITVAPEPFDLDINLSVPRNPEALQSLLALLQRLFPPELSLTRQMEGIIAYYEPILKRIHADDYPKRVQDLEHFAGLAANYGSRAEMLTALALDPIELSAVDTAPAQKDEPPLVLSTIHSAKGLEFHTVFLIQALDGILPSSYSIKSVDDLDEELRLLYVAVTRAETSLFISYPILRHRSHGDYLPKPSRFLTDIPEALLEPWVLIEEPVEPPRQLSASQSDGRSV